MGWDGSWYEIFFVEGHLSIYHANKQASKQASETGNMGGRDLKERGSLSYVCMCI
jgi:hypothetical protein